MADPRLNSVHLEPARRQEYRRARDDLLRGRGCQTIGAGRDGDSRSFGHTLIPRQDGTAESTFTCWLLDGDFLYPLSVGVNTLGRSGDNDVVVEDAHASRRHCAILVHVNNRCELHDTASKNGTYLNGARLSGPTPLQSGDEIRIGNQPFVFLHRSGELDVTSPGITE